MGATRYPAADPEWKSRVCRREISIVIYVRMAFDVELVPAVVGFLRSIDPKLRAKAARSIESLRRFGSALSMPHAKRLSGYVKKTDKTSRTETDKAMRLRSAVLEGEGEGN